VMVASVSLPDANFVPLQLPLAVQPEATGVVDHVSTGTRLPAAEVWFAVKVIVPAVCASASEPNNNIGRARSANLNLCIWLDQSRLSKAEGFRRRRKCRDAAVVQGRGS